MRRVSGGFALGARIILLDYVMRQADQLLTTAAPLMRLLASRTGCDCVLTAVYGSQILDVHREPGAAPLALAYGRGRPRPPFQGAAPKVILAAQPTAWVRTIYQAGAQAAAAAGMGRDWKEFRASLAAIRRRGFHVSLGELEPHIHAIAAPIAPHGAEPAAAIALVVQKERFALLNEAVLVSLVRQAAEEISARRAAQPPAASNHVMPPG